MAASVSREGLCRTADHVATIAFVVASRCDRAALNCFLREAPSSVMSTDPLCVQVALGPRSYEIIISSGKLSSSASLLGQWLSKISDQRSAPGKALLVTDKNVAHPHADAVEKSLIDAGWACVSQQLEPGERSKALNIASDLYDKLVEMQADRQTVVLAVGGGVVGDLAGFVAATYVRGLRFMQVPTTLLAQVDSSVGGKVGINHPQGKNLIGAFHQPLGVLIDTDTLASLPERDYRSGLAEVIKYGVILDEQFFGYLESNVEGLNQRAPDVLRQVIATCCRLKADVVEQDEQERTGVRAMLNYGHTFAHAFEALCGYGELMHGEAVAIGMVCASQLAERRGLIDENVTERQIELLAAVGLPTVLSDTFGLKSDDLLGRMKLDKKVAAGKLRFVLPTRMGHVALFDDVLGVDVRTILDR